MLFDHEPLTHNFPHHEKFVWHFQTWLQMGIEPHTFGPLSLHPKYPSICSHTFVLDVSLVIPSASDEERCTQQPVHPEEFMLI